MTKKINYLVYEFSDHHMASGSSVIYMSPTLPGLTRTIPPTVLTPPSTSSGTPAGKIC